MNIVGISADTRLKLKLLAAVNGVSMIKMVSDLIEKAFNDSSLVVSKRQKTKMRRIIKRWA